MIPEAPLDVLAQQIVAACAASGGRTGSPFGTEHGLDGSENAGATVGTESWLATAGGMRMSCMRCRDVLIRIGI